MIIKIDHVALESDSPSSALKFLIKRGYNIVFKDTNVPILDIKQSFLLSQCITHDLTLLSHLTNYDIELLSHKTPNKSNSGEFIGVFDDVVGFKDWEEVISLLQNSPLKSKEPHFQYYGDLVEKTFGFNTIMLDVAEIEQDVNFWRNCGFQEIFKRDQWSVMKFTDIFKQKSQFLVLRQKKNIHRKMYLDIIGFNCLALISNNIQDEIMNFREKGYTCTKIELLEVNRTSLNISFTRSPSGANVELIGII